MPHSSRRVELELQRPHVFVTANPLRLCLPPRGWWGRCRAFPIRSHRLLVPSFTPNALSQGTSRAASNGKRSYLMMRTSRKGCTILVDGNGASWGKFLFLPSLGSLQEQVESSILQETQLSRWLGQGGERPGNGDSLAFGAGTLTMRPPGSSPSRKRHSDLPQMCSQAR